MATMPEAAPGVPGAPARLQRADPDLADAWTREANAVTLAENIDRLAVDVELVMDMGLEGFNGPVWDQFANELVKYGIAVLRSWLANGAIYARCAEKGRPVVHLGRPFDEDEIEGLADETVGVALHHFRQDVLMKHKWDGRRGATIRTYFIGQCLLRFPNIYRAYQADLDRNGWMLADELEMVARLGDAVPALDRHVVPRITAEIAIDSVKDPRVRRAMVMTADGWSQAEIAQTLGVSEKAVERMLANERARLRRKGIA